MRSQSIGFMPVILSSHPAPILPVNKAAGRPWEAAWMLKPLLAWFSLVCTMDQAETHQDTSLAITVLQSVGIFTQSPGTGDSV